LQRFDSNARILSKEEIFHLEFALIFPIGVDWALKYIINGKPFPLAERRDEITRIGIFRDQRLVPLNGILDMYNSPKNVSDISVIGISNSSATPIAIVGMTPMDSFSTDIGMSQAIAASSMVQPQFGFPFDLVG
jgi:hypothetical protein